MRMGVSFKISFCKLGCSSSMRSFCLFVNVGEGSLSIFCKNVHHKVVYYCPSYNLYLLSFSMTTILPPLSASLIAMLLLRFRS